MIANVLEDKNIDDNQFNSRSQCELQIGHAPNRLQNDLGGQRFKYGPTTWRGLIHVFYCLRKCPLVTHLGRYFKLSWNLMLLGWRIEHEQIDKSVLFKLSSNKNETYGLI